MKASWYLGLHTCGFSTNEAFETQCREGCVPGWRSLDNQNSMETEVFDPARREFTIAFVNLSIPKYYY